MPEPLRAGSPASGPDGLSPTRFYDPVRVELEELLAEGDLESALVTVPRPRKPDPAAPLPNSSPPLPSFDVPQIGTVIAETYRVVSELGRGAMGVVLLAEDQRLGRKVAIKLIQETLFAEHFRDRFLLEARVMAELRHPNLLAVHAFGEHRGQPYFVMEFVEGTTLYQLITGEPKGVELDVALRILDEICAAVSVMHAASTVHRDLKPANILLDSRLGVRVADLGLAQKFVAEPAQPELVGTPGYIAPEVAREDEHAVPASPCSDVYSIACMAYELLTGAPPFDAQSDVALMALHATAPVPKATTLRADLPPVFDAVLERGLAKDPNQRTKTVAQFRSELLAARAASFEPSRILVAEDEQDFRELLQLKLNMAFPDADIECVCDGQAALTAFDRKPASVVILDLQMPVLDGMAATVLLRARPAAATVPILVLTASGGPNEWKLLSSLGADRFLVKPVDLEDVVTIVRGAVKRRAQLQSNP